MSTLQVELDNTIRQAADSLFESLGLDTVTAIKIFLTASINAHGIPFAVKKPDGSYICEHGFFHDYSKFNLDEYEIEKATAKSYTNLAEMWADLDAEDDDEI